MNMNLELREKRAKAWDAAKAFLDSKRNTDGLLTAEDAASYEKLEADVVALGKEIDRIERADAMDRELARPTSAPLTVKPGAAAPAEKQGHPGRRTARVAEELGLDGGAVHRAGIRQLLLRRRARI